MRQNFLKLFFLSLVIPAIMISCEEENEDTMPPGLITNAEVDAMDLSVQLTWDDPADEDLDKVIITYTNEIEYVIRLDPGVQEYTVDDLNNGQEYTFKLKAVDVSGNESEEIVLMATPVLKVARIDGFEIENGTYKHTDENDFIIIYTFSGTNGLYRSLQAGSNLFSWEGTWERSGITINTEVENTETQVVYNDTISAAFCFELESEKYYYHGAYEKISGEADELLGEYEYNIKDDNDIMVKSLQLTADGTYKVHVNNDLETEGSWTDDDIRNKKFVFIDFMDKRFIYFPESYVLKQE